MTNEIGMFNLSTAAPASRREPVPSAVGPPAAAVENVPAGNARLEEPAQPKKAALADTVKDLNDLAQELHRELRFAVDDESGEMVIKVVDQKTDKVIRQIPSEEVVQLRQRLAEATGAIFRDTA